MPWDQDQATYATGRGFRPKFAEPEQMADSTTGDPSDDPRMESAMRLGTQMATEMSGAFLAHATAASAQYARDTRDLHEDLPGSILDEAEMRANGRFGMKNIWKGNVAFRGQATNEEWRFAAPPPALGAMGTRRVGDTGARRQASNTPANKPNAGIRRLGASDSAPDSGFVRSSAPLGIGPVGGADPHGYASGYQRRGSQFGQFRTPALSTGSGGIFGGNSGVGAVREDEPVEAELVE